jgi:hypothetical protein
LATHANATKSPPPPSALAAPEKIASYKIDARLELDDQQHPTQLSGREQLSWRNASPDTISELQFHLYLNAFKNQQSTFFKESGGQLRGDTFAAGEWGWIDVNSIKIIQGKIASGEDLTGKLRFIHPDDDNASDQTVVSVPLSQPLKPHETIVLDIQFTARLPRVYARTGYWGKFALVAQWFPKIGVWEEAGERRRAVSGWNCHQFHANTEFYADYGDYDVTLTVPASYKGKIGATGAQQSEQTNSDGTLSYRFTQANVHDFAWTVDAQYVVLQRDFKPAEWIKPEDIKLMSERLRLPASEFNFAPVSVTVLLQPEHLSQAERHVRAAFHSLKYFQLWYGKYPYATLTVVDPPYNAEGAGGMEYPTFITAGTNWWTSEDHNPETVIVHEFGHQYWYGLVATNEFEESWLDEGFNTYSEIKVMQIAYGDDRLPIRLADFPVWDFPVKAPHVSFYRLGTMEGHFNDPIQTPAWQYLDFNSYGMNSYSRTGLMLLTLEAWLGEDVMARVMRAYATRWRFRHPTAQDFFAVAHEISGQDLSWFFNQFVLGTATLDYEVVDFGEQSSALTQGVFDQDGWKVENHEKPKESETVDSRITVRRLGDAWYPHVLLVTLEDASQVKIQPLAVSPTHIEYRLTHEKTGQQWQETWPHQERWHRFQLKNFAKIESVQLDPENQVALEANQVNNSFAKTVAIGSAARWAAGLMFWLQSVLQLVASFA